MSQGVGSGSHRASRRWVSPIIIRLISALAALFLVATPLLTAQSAAAAPAAAPADDLRVTLNRLGQEHVYLAGTAIAAALGGRNDEFKVAADATDMNSVELSKAIGSVYGPQAEQTFLALWRAHIGMFVEYTQGAAAKDNAKKQKAMNDLQGYRQDIGAFLASANPNLPKEAVADLFGPHVTHLTGAIDALAAGDAAKGYMMLHDAAHQTQDIMDPLADAIVKQFPDKFAGTVKSPASDLRTTLNLLGEEHVYLAGYAFNAAIAGRSDEFKIAAAAVDQNTQELGKAIGSVYGPQAEQSFLDLWRTHIGMFADYATGAATNDNAKKQKAMNDLQGYRQDIGAFLASANPNLPKETVADLFGPHVTHLTGTIDALAAKDAPKAYMMLHDAAHQTMDIMDPLAGAIVKQFPDKFPAGMTQQAAPAAAPKPAGNPPAAAAAPAPAAAAKPAAGVPAAAQSPAQMPAALPRTGEAPSPFLPAAIAALIGLMLVGGGLAVSRARR